MDEGVPKLAARLVMHVVYGIVPSLSLSCSTDAIATHFDILMHRLHLLIHLNFVSIVIRMGNIDHIALLRFRLSRET